MKIPLRSWTLLPALGLPFLLQDGGEPKKHKGPETELGQRMERLEDAARVVRKNLKDPANWPAALAALVEVEGLTLECKALTPAAAAKLPDAERGAFVGAYRRTMVEFLTHELELEGALLDGDAELAKQAFERFRSMEDSAHERFAPEDD